jgi:hypothetical protein
MTWDGRERRHSSPPNQQLLGIELSIQELKIQSENNHKAMRETESRVMEMLENHHQVLYGKNGHNGHGVRIDRLEVAEQNRKENFKLAWGAIVVCLIQATWNMISFLIKLATREG